ncbi:NACHT domain-containing NTPase [Limnothrix sp. FACHB-708]|uniref:NACHT domain-containing protein n=1 Tax=unclassified Limnothrix TaxID=2632864 RepID=UPI00168851D3|nr:MULTISPECIES: NACHT domain-containing NTPase [unclassified Limnothrix]MBD2552723.1 NACHT domain-containing NTPase [Limnothrix sp. FACHB-708]MBD2589993.1 NACHT domain-containing NTPase [Limnothrix sp. FACHB-406]
MNFYERSLRATAVGCEKLAESLKKSNYTKSSIGDFIQYRKSSSEKGDREIKQVGVKRQTISKMFNGHKVDRRIFLEVCKLLGLNWQEITELATSEPPAPSVASDAIDVAWVRSQVEADLRRRCGTMRVLDMEQPIALGTIYTQVNVLEKLTANQRLSSSELLGNLDEIEEFDRFCLGKVRQEKISGLDAVTRHKALMVLGWPGAGKTTFLKYLTIACLDGKFLGNLVPIFVTLKEWTEFPGEPNLLNFVSQQWSDCGITDSESVLHQCLKYGQALVLLDGLDEVLAAHTDRTIREMRNWVDRFPKNHILATCRIAAKEYTFERFTEVEVADFSEEQIQEFVTNWFTCHQDLPKIERFLERLANEEPILELASNPLLLTLLCLVFGESGDFPVNRAKLYEEGVDLLLKKWDGKRNIQRDQVYKNLSIGRKEDLLSQLALATFQEGSYFFDQRVAEEQIMAYIHNLPDAKDDPEALRLDSEAILRSIVAQHGLLTERARGVYSFSHLTFHEYFAAREIVDRQNWQLLTQHLLDKAWREVTLLVAGSVRQGDQLILTLKQATDNLLADDPQLQAVLAWSTEKAASVEAPYKPQAVIAFYSTRALTRGIASDLAIVKTFDLTLFRGLNFAIDFAFDQAFALALNYALALSQDSSPDYGLSCEQVFNLNLNRAHAHARNLNNQDLVAQLTALKGQLQPIRSSPWKQRKKWWKNEGQDWIRSLRAVMIEHRNIGHDWQFSDRQKELLWKYHDANLRLAECLNTDCYLSREVRQDIEATMLRPIAQIEAYYAAKGKPYPPVPNP